MQALLTQPASTRGTSLAPARARLSWTRRLIGILNSARARRRLLDVRELPDHLKRDIGALDGNDPRPPRR